MEFKLNTLFVFIATLVVVTQNTQAASTTNGKLLKFYPITRDQYTAILKLASQQSVISEARAIESHRSLADWSNSLHHSWNNLFNYTKPYNNEVVKGYPMCVIKSDDTERRRRSARQYDSENDYEYAGLAPNVVYTGPQGYPHYDSPYPYAAENGEETEEEPNNTEPEDNDPGVKRPMVNCVVVVHRKNKGPTGTGMHRPDLGHGHTYPHYHYPYPPPGYYPPPPPYGYKPYYGGKYRYNEIQSGHSAIDPAAEAYYQQSLREYYDHLNELYMADASTQEEGQDDNAETQYDNAEAQDDNAETQDDNEQVDDQYNEDTEQTQIDETELDERDF